MQAWLDPRLAALRSRLPARAPGGAHAGVAVLLRPGAGDLEVLLILRAERPGDPWSGHVALPGGRRDPEDRDDLATAVRETREEVGIDLLAAGVLLGGLSPVHPRSDVGGMLVAPWVFGVRPGTLALPNAEVQAARWVAVGELAAPSARAKHRHLLPNGGHATFPAVRVQGFLVWGMTFRVLATLLQAASASTS